MGDVLRAEGRQLQPVVHGAGHGLAAVHLCQREDLTQVHARVHAPCLQALAVGLGPWGQGQELHQQTLLAGALALLGELLGMLGKLDVRVALHAAYVARDELVTGIQAHAIGPGLHGQALPDVARGHRVGVGIQRDAELLVDADRAHPGEVEPHGAQRLEVGPFFFEHVHRAAVGGAVHAHVGHRVHPQLRGGLHC